MRKPYQIPFSENEIICPECGSPKIKMDETVDVKTGTGTPLKQYTCEACNTTFIPAINGKINEWSKKVRSSEGLNEGRSWKNTDNIIIKRKI